MKAFTNHKDNGFALSFDNGMSISTIFGYGSYSENHDYNPAPGKTFDYKNMAKMFEKIPEGSKDCEIMISGDPDFIKTLAKKYDFDASDSIKGYVPINEWIAIVVDCWNYKRKEKLSLESIKQ